MIDFGDDRLTRGRPHPMIDGSTRVERLLAEIADPSTGVLLLDVVLGLGAAADPAAELAAGDPGGEPRRHPGGGQRGRHPRRPAGPAGPGGRSSTTRARGCSCPTPPLPARRSTCSPQEAPHDACPPPRPSSPPARRCSPSPGAAGRRRVRRSAGSRPPATPRRVAAGDGRPAAARGERAGPRGDARRGGAPGRRTARRRRRSGWSRGQFLHAGPPVDWERASGPLRGALVGAMLFEGLAASPEEAERDARGRRGRGLGAVPPPRRRRADGRGRLPVDVGVLPARRRSTATSPGAR